ncbi:DUF6069 family protein [Nesterenkonia suensis]
MSITTAQRTGATRPLIITGAVVVLVTTTLNLGVFLTAQALGASLRLDPPGQDPNHLLWWVDVLWKTALPLAIGIALVALLRRSPRGAADAADRRADRRRTHQRRARVGRP